MKWLRSPKTPILTALPTGMTAADDGREIRLLIDQNAGIACLLRYRHFQADRVTVNPSAYKWECLGVTGGIIGYVSATYSGFSHTTFGAVPSQVTGIVPFSGDYELSYYATLASLTAGQFVYFGVAFAGTVAGETLFTAATSSAPYSVPGYRLNGLVAGNVVDIRTRVSGGQGQVASGAWNLRPVRVG